MSVPNLTDAPGFRSINQLAAGRSGVQGVLAAANEIHGHTRDADRLARDNERLREMADELLVRVQELTEECRELNRTADLLIDEKCDLYRCIQQLQADADDVAETLADLRDINMRLINEVAVLRSERDNLRAQVSAAKP